MTSLRQPHIYLTVLYFPSRDFVEEVEVGVFLINLVRHSCICLHSIRPLFFLFWFLHSKRSTIFPGFYQSGFYDDLRFCSFSCFLCLQGNCSVSLRLCMKTDEVLFGMNWNLGLGKCTKFGRGQNDVCRRIEILNQWLQNVINNSSKAFL